MFEYGKINRIKNPQLVINVKRLCPFAPFNLLISSSTCYRRVHLIQPFVHPPTHRRFVFHELGLKQVKFRCFFEYLTGLTLFLKINTVAPFGYYRSFLRAPPSCTGSLVDDGCQELLQNRISSACTFKRGVDLILVSAWRLFYLVRYHYRQHIACLEISLVP